MELTNITGIGPKTIKLLNNLQIYTVEDLITYYPYRYNVYSFNKLIDTKDVLIVSAIIETSPKVAYIKRNFNKMSFRANIDNNLVNIVIFNRAFLLQNLNVGKQITLIGKMDFRKNTFTANDIKFNIQNGDIEPKYHLIKGVSNNLITKCIKSALNTFIYEDKLPNDLIANYNLFSFKESIYSIHFPKNIEDVKKAKIRLKYEELFDFTFKMNYINKIRKKDKGIAKSFSHDEIDKMINNLPFELTSDQLKVVDDILKELSGLQKMNRLILGDVGSGKTIVSTIGIYANYLAGYQSALMAPTEILANQHYYSISNILKNCNMKIALIDGSMSKKEKNELYSKTEAGEIDLLIGTHAILNENLNFKDLGLIITDEQHRFGVNQRSTLHQKSQMPDIIYLSATPIPRTYAMTIYGDLDISLIKTKPFGRLPIITKVKKEKEIKDVLLAMLEEIKKNHQIYIVSPLVEQNDDVELSSVEYLKEKIDLAYQGKIKTEIIHGKMKQKDKDAIMNDFKNNRIKILIATTVIEVGIDVSNATMMVIFNAERFGLATLHQLRGRVGRNDVQSYCYLISDYEIERLKVLEESNDGFYISECDFKMRGHGDLFGTKQSGDMTFRIADLANDYNILVQAKNDSENFINSNDYINNEYYKKITDELYIAD